MEKEKEKNINRLSPLSLTRNTVYLGTIQTFLNPSRLCESWIPLSNNETDTLFSLKNLRRNMGYFFFKKMIKDLGIPEEDILTFQDTTKRFAGDYS